MDGSFRLTGAYYDWLNSPGTSGYILSSTATGTKWVNPISLSDGDWTVSGNNMYSSLPGNVGIGTNNPGYKLVVNGSISISDGNAYYIGSGKFIHAPGAFNTSIGNATGSSIISGQKNVFIGQQAGRYTTEGNQNTFMGSNSGENNTTGNNNVYIGYAAGYNNQIGSGNVFIGKNAGKNSTDSTKLFIDNSATSSPLIWGDFANDTVRINGTLDIAGAYHFPLADGTTGQVLQTDGSGALSWNDDEGAIQINDLSDGKTIGNGVFLGPGAGTNVIEYDNQSVAVGKNALHANTSGSWNTAIGSDALYSNTDGGGNTAIGSDALSENNGTMNTASGCGALLYNSTGNRNTASGFGALLNNMSGDYNTAIGYYSGPPMPFTNLDNITTIGYNATTNGSNRICIGNTSVTWIGGQVVWSTYSDSSAKKYIKEDVKGLGFITKLRPVTYHFDKDKMDAIMGVSDSSDYDKKYDIENIKQSGFLAQEVEKAAKESGYDFSGVKAPVNENTPYSLSYAEFVVPLVKAVQEQQTMIDDQKQLIDELKKRIEQLEKR